MFANYPFMPFFCQKIFGTPHRPRRGCCYRKEAFGLERGARQEVMESVPHDTNVLLSHGPPFGVGDLEGVGHMGDGLLLDAIYRVRPAVVVFGHVHQTRGRGSLQSVHSLCHLRSLVLVLVSALIKSLLALTLYDPSQLYAHTQGPTKLSTTMNLKVNLLKVLMTIVCCAVGLPRLSYLIRVA